MFINLSNHPSSKWSAEQYSAAAAFGPVVDMPFPTINPHSTTEEITSLAEQYASRIAEGRGDEPLTVHVMGEMTFTYHLVRLLKRQGIDCVASTTERVVVDVDGAKASQFSFVQFRHY